MIKIRGKAKAIMNGIIDYTNLMMMSPPLISFLSSLFKKGQFIPDNFLTSFEQNRFYRLDSLGAIQSITREGIKSIIGSYLLLKILVAKILSS